MEVVRVVACDQDEPTDLVAKDFNQDSIESVVMGNAKYTDGPGPMHTLLDYCVPIVAATNGQVWPSCLEIDNSGP